MSEIVILGYIAIACGAVSMLGTLWLLVMALKSMAAERRLAASAKANLQEVARDLRHIGEKLAPVVLVAVGCATAAAEIPRRPEPITDRVHKIEHNVIHTGDGSPRFTQIILDDETAIVGWRQVNSTTRTRRDNGGWLTTWVETDGTLRAVWSREFEEVHTGGGWDREVTERAWTPECQRRGLSKPNVRRSTK